MPEPIHKAVGAIAKLRDDAMVARIAELEAALRGITKDIDHHPTRIMDSSDGERGWAFAANVLDIVESRAAAALPDTEGPE